MSSKMYLLFYLKEGGGGGGGLRGVGESVKFCLYGFQTPRIQTCRKILISGLDQNLFMLSKNF